METPQKRQKSWFSSLTGLVSGNRSSEAEGRNGISASIKKVDASSANNFIDSSQLRSTKAAIMATPSHYSGTFSAPPVESPESPAKRASPTLLAQRKIHGRALGPSGKVMMSTSNKFNDRDVSGSISYSNGDLGHLNSSSTPRRTNFSSTATPKNMFRDSIARELPTFTFTPRVPSNTLKGNFPAATPGRSFRSSGIELSGREMAKTSSSELFTMKIPDPDPELSGEAVAGMVPKDAKAGNRSVYANEYLANLCPPDFNEEQRNQFFCILDLRRLKYAADEVFLKKDWRLNILNFAKEYEKNRSLIMLRYGLYEFKTVRVSKDVFHKWKTANNVPDLGEEADKNEAESISACAKSALVSKTSRSNGTQGILRSEKRKAEDDMNSSSSALNSVKRSRPLDGSHIDRVTDREPLTETSTPSLNKFKRKATSQSDPEGVQRSKQQKSSCTPASAPPSATRALFEKISNSPNKAVTDEIPNNECTIPKSSPLKEGNIGQSSKPPSNSLARSVLESGLKGNTTQSNANIFGYLSDASSAKGSGNDNADADGEDTDDSDGQEESATQETNGEQSPSSIPPAGGFNKKTSEINPSFSMFSTTPMDAAVVATSAPFGSSASSEASEPVSGRSLFDRVNKTSDGHPIRVVATDTASLSLGTPAFGNNLAVGDKSSVNEPAAASSLFGSNKTWTPDSPIKFAASHSTPQITKPLFGAVKLGDNSAHLTESSSASKLGAFAAVADTKATETDSTPSLFGTGAISNTAKEGLNKIESAPVAAKASSDFSKDVIPSSTSEVVEAKTTAAPSRSSLNASIVQSATAAAPSLLGAKTAGSTFGSTSTSVSTTTSSIFGAAQAPAFVANGATAPSLFGFAGSSIQPATNPNLQSQTLFGSTPKADSTLAVQGQKRGVDDEGDSSASALFGSPMKIVTADSDEQPQAKKLLGSLQATAAPTPAALFSFGPKINGASEEVSKPPFGLGTSTTSVAEPGKTLFGNMPTSTSGTSSSSIFNFGNSSNNNNTTSQPPASFSFSGPPQGSSTESITTAPVFGSSNTVSAPSSFTFSVGGNNGSSATFRNPFAGNNTGSFQTAPVLSFGAQSSTSTPSPFQFGAGASPTPTAPATGNDSSALFSFGAGSQPSSQASGALASGSTNSASMFSFGAGTSAQASSTSMFGQQASVTGAANGPIFNLAPPVGGTSTGTNTPFTNPGGASSLATTPASGTPEPAGLLDKVKDKDSAVQNETTVDGEEPSQEQLSLTDGGPGEEDEVVVYEVRAKAMKLASAKDDTDGSGGGSSTTIKDKKSPWKTEGVGPLRILKHKTTNAVRLLLRGEPRGHVALNRALLPDFGYKPEGNAKYVKLTTANETGSGLETWMLQVKTKEAAQELAEALETNKSANKK